MKTRTKGIIAVLVVVGLIAFFTLPVMSFNTDGQTLFLGKPFTPYNSSLECAIEGCHCVLQESLSSYLFGIGYSQLEGCP